MSEFYRRCIHLRRAPRLSQPIADNNVNGLSRYFSHHPQNPSRIYAHFSQEEWKGMVLAAGVAPERADQYAKNIFEQQERSIAADKKGNNRAPRRPAMNIKYAYEA